MSATFTDRPASAPEVWQPLSETRQLPAASRHRRSVPPRMRATGRFLLHVVEMTIVMQVGMGILWVLLIPGLIPPLYEALRDHTSDLHGLAMALAMALPMLPWMRLRGHGWSMGIEMVAAMVLPWAAVVLICRLGADTYLPWMRGTASPAMILGMLAVMLYRRDHYIGIGRH